MCSTLQPRQPSGQEQRTRYRVKLYCGSQYSPTIRHSGPNIGASQYSPQTNIQYEESKPKGLLRYMRLLQRIVLPRTGTDFAAEQGHYFNIHPIARLQLLAALPNMLDFHATQAS